MTEHPSLEQTAPKPSKPAEKTESFSEQLKKLREQIQPVDLSPIMSKLENIEAELVGFKPYIEKKIELLDTELRIARMFEAFLKKKAE